MLNRKSQLVLATLLKSRNSPLPPFFGEMSSNCSAFLFLQSYNKGMTIFIMMLFAWGPREGGAVHRDGSGKTPWGWWYSWGVGGVSACNSVGHREVTEDPWARAWQEQSQLVSRKLDKGVLWRRDGREEEMTMGRRVRTPGSSYEGLRPQRLTGLDRRKC